jgi:tetratricopeptide (TPR) repeat protein
MRPSRGLLLGSLALAPLTARAQAARPVDPLKRTIATAPQRPACAPTPSVPAVGEAQRRQARDLAERGRQAAILGDSTAAMNNLRQASNLDPTNADLAYELARAYETAGAKRNAAAEYCRFLSLAPNAPESQEALEKARTLAPPTRSAAFDAGVDSFRAGLTAFDRGQMTIAEAHFSRAIQADTMWADAYYDRGLARLGSGDRVRAAADFEQYLRRKPDATDRAAVFARVDALRRPTLDAQQALSFGVIPGGGQFYAHRITRGALSAVGAAAAVALAFQSRKTETPVEQTGTDPFGNPYTYTTNKITTDHPYMVPGLAVAGAITAISAIDAFLYVRRITAPPQRVSMSVFAYPHAVSVVARVTLP